MTRLTEAYRLMQDHCGIQVGDKVKIAKHSYTGEMGWKHNWIEDMDRLVRINGRVKRIEGNMGILVEFSKAICEDLGIEAPPDMPLTRYFPFFVLEVIEKAPKYDFSDFKTIREMHRALWDWLEDNPDRGKNEWPRWKKNGGNIDSEEIEDFSFLCTYVRKNKKTCVDCPGVWLTDMSPEDIEDQNELKPCLANLYGAWLDAMGLATTQYYNRRLKVRIANMIKNVI